MQRNFEIVVERRCLTLLVDLLRVYYREIARGPIAGDTSGLIKLIFHAETLGVLAVHIIGTGATELIPLGQMAIALRVRVDYFVDNIFNYPTFAEGFRIAALDGMNKVQGSAAAALLGGPS